MTGELVTEISWITNCSIASIAEIYRQNGPVPLMNVFRSLDLSSNALAKRALLSTGFLALAGSLLGVFAIAKGTVTGPETALVSVGLLFSVLTLVLIWSGVSTQMVAALTTTYWTAALAAGAIISISGPDRHLNLLIYLVWFFSLLALNRLLNEPIAAKYLSRGILLAPVVIVACSWSRLSHIFPLEVLTIVIGYLLSYLCTGIALNTVSSYREAYIVERELAKTLGVESEVLESISDCFFSLDTEFRLVYLNDAACLEFAVQRELALGRILYDVAPGFMSQPMRTGLQSALEQDAASTFEAQDKPGARWYSSRCFPKAGGVSVYFRNITEETSQRRELDQANEALLEQAGLLDKAQDSMVVVDMHQRIVFWNKGAESLYGWTSAEALGQLVRDLVITDTSYFDTAVATLYQHGEWTGEQSPRHKDGHLLLVESHWTLVRDNHGKPHSIFSLSSDISKRKAAEDRIHHLAFYDSLTGLPNRVLLSELLQKALAALRDSRKIGAVLFIDLDNFKGLNDTLGHEVGDLLLQQVAQRIRSCVAPGDTVARLGADEFMVMLEERNDTTAEATIKARMMARRIIATFQHVYTIGNYEWNGTASIGIALFNGSLESVEVVLKRANLAMFRAKANGRNAIRVFDPEMETAVAERASLEADLRRAVRNRELRLVYQPQVGAAGTVTGAEVLLRWSHPLRGKVMPDRFIPLAEETGLIIPIGKWILESACVQLVKWAAHPDTRSLDLAVNVSVQQFQDPDFVPILHSVLNRTGANPRRLKLEITESLLVKEQDDTIRKMKSLNALGIRFSLDDFGTGYSSLSQLKHLPLDQMKIDRGFIRDVMTDPKDASIVLAIIRLSQSLGLKLVAEGVETEEQRQFLLHHGCSNFQGYLFSPGLNSAKFLLFNRQLRQHPRIAVPPLQPADLHAASLALV